LKEKKNIGDSHLVEVCAGIRGNAFEDLHILDEELASGINLGDIRAIFPERAQSGVDQALSPGRVEACRLGVHTGHLSARDDAIRELFSGRVLLPRLWETH
jgi:hypothetical protein